MLSRSTSGTPPSASQRENGFGTQLRDPRRSLLLVTLALLLVGIVVFLLGQPVEAPGRERFVVGELVGREFRLEVADTPEALAQGLSGRPGLPDDQGMLFVFPAPDKACFWMKDMRFNLDILWFDAYNKLLDQQLNVAPSSFPQTYCAPAPATYVLEIKPGLVRAQPGDELRLQKQ